MLDIYSITAFLFLLLSFVFWGKDMHKRPAKTFFIICLLWLVIHDGFRWEIGTDWDNYRALFEYEEGTYHMGIVYVFLNSLIHKITDSYTAVTLTIAVIMYFVLGWRFIRKYSPQPFMSICLMYMGLLGLMGCNRQLLALMCCLLSMPFIFERKLFPFLGCVLLAIGFHITAALFIPAYFLVNFKYKNKTLMAFVIASFIVGLTHIVNRIPLVEYLAIIDNISNSTSLSGYVTKDEIYGVSILGSFKRVFFVYLALRARHRINNKTYDFAVLMYTIGAIIYLCFNGSMLQLMASRGCLYFNIFDLIWIPYFITYIPVRNRSLRRIGRSQLPAKKRLWIRAVWLAFFLLYFYFMNRDINTYIVQVGFDIFRPYKSVLF